MYSRRGKRSRYLAKIEYDSYSGNLSIMLPSSKILSDEDDGLHTGRIVPIYTAVGKVSTRIFRTLIDRILRSIDPIADPLPQRIVNQLKLPDLWTALRGLHFPAPDAQLRLLNAFRSPEQFRLIFR